MATKSTKVNVNKAGKKAKFPLTRERFMSKAPRSLTVMVGEMPVVAVVKEFSTGSVGFYANGKITLEIDGENVDFQVGMNITAIGSKPE